ncbi:MAG: aldose 1-epimerase family protein [Chloroflexi bacterium]|nr:aldose 1-epimerase family protein [Chloroflexota bacterium]
MYELLEKDWNRQELIQRVGHMDQIAGIVAAEASDGMGRGSRYYHVYTGSGLSFNVMADRTLDIAACRYKGIPLAWASSSGWMHPSYYEADGLGWLRSFQGGLCTTCGLDQIGAPSEDGGESYGIHGRISNMPAEQVSHRTFWEGDSYRLEVSGSVRQTRLFGENFLLQRRISTALGSNAILLEDTITNQGFEPQPHLILYHCNLGFPLLSEHARLLVDVEDTIPRDADAEPGIDRCFEFQAPTPGYKEQVFRHVPNVDAEGKVHAVVENPQLGLSMRISFFKEQLPHLFQWKQMGQGAYVLGIEPANSSGVEGRAIARARDDLPHLAPGESTQYQLEFEVGTLHPSS